MAFADQNDASAARGDFLHVRDRLFENRVVRRQHDDGHRLVDQRDWPMLELASGVTLGVNIGQFLQFQRAFERQRKKCASAQVENVPRPRQLV